jgi:hypothetical protein
MQQRQKLQIQTELSLFKSIFINIDFLLNSRQLKEAGVILRHIQRQLKDIYKENKLTEIQY